MADLGADSFLQDGHDWEPKGSREVDGSLLATQPASATATIYSLPKEEISDETGFVRASL
jgi:hypothetical protein